jgi:SAM-dependent methyltransferase
MSQVKNKNINLLIPGAGDIYDAAAFLELGFTHITVCDISETAIQNMKQVFGEDARLQYFHGDFFNLEGQYDLIIEQTFFCALDPELRKKYVAKMASLLTQGGKLVGVLFNRTFEEAGPPWGGDVEEYIHLFEPTLRIKKLEMCYNSIAQRHGSELFIMMEKPEKERNI